MSPIDLTTLAAVKGWLASQGVAPNNTSDDGNIGDAITAFSAMFIWRTGRGPLDGSDIVESPYVSPVTYDEWYDGNGSQRMFLRNSPIRDVTTLTIGNYTIPKSTNINTAGWVIDGTGASIALRNHGGGSFTQGYNFGFGGSFVEDIQNVHVVYSAGYSSVPYDIEMAARKEVALKYKRKSWIGLKSSSMGQGAGSTTYVEWEVDPETERVMQNYARTAVV